MNLFTLLAQLRKSNIRIWQEDGQLKFKAPVGAMTSEFRRQIQDEKAALIELLKQQESESTDLQFEPIPQCDRSERLPLSASQESLWVIDQLSPGGHEYNIPAVLRLEGNLNVEALHYAVNTIVERHEILRTRYKQDAIGAYQVISENIKLEIPILDLRKLKREERQETAQKTIHELGAKGFNLEHDLMLRTQLIRLEDNLHLFIFCTHHIASDGGSLWILTHELSTLYTNQVSGRSLPLPSLGVQYADFACWQRQWLAGKKANEALGFWKNTLGGIPDVHSLPLDRPRPARQSFCGKQYRQFISNEQVKLLNTFAKDKGATTFMVLHTALAALLYRYSHDQDIIIGTPIANRNHPEQSRLVGFFANTLVLRSKILPTTTFEELLSENKEYLLQAYQNQQLPFETLVDAIQPDRSLSSNSLFQVMLVLQNNRQAVLDLSGLTLSIEHQDNGTSKFDLTLLINITDNGYCIDWEYATDLFNEETIARMSVHFGLLLKAVTTNPSTVISYIPLHTTLERHNLLSEWSSPKEIPIPYEGLHQLFEQKARSIPEAPAVTQNGDEWSYEALNSEANRLAHILIESGVKPDDIVAFCIPRNVSMLIAILAILKAGGCYLPLDTSYSDAILLKRLSSAQPALVITTRETDKRLTTSEASRICINDTGLVVRLSAASTTNPEVPFCSDQLAYVLSTSGSTGEPKLIGMPHLPLVNLIEAMRSDCPQLTKAHTVLQFASISFDMSFTDIFLAWSGGGKLCLISESEKTDLDALVGILQTENVSVVNFPYSLLQALTHYCNSSKLHLENLKVVISTAERLLVTEEIRNFFARHPDTKLLNHFGPSETHVCTSLVMTGDPQSWSDIPSIGKPIANVRCYVLDESLNIAPLGVYGELYVGGIGIARGYLNLPELTSKRFLDDPLVAKVGARMYQTGDTVRWLDNGELQFLERKDTQVKLRGFRIELSEIETALLKYSTVSDAVVVFDEEHKQLVAYVAGKEAINSSTLKEYLREQLPEYMMPSAISILDRLPLNTNGKVDRIALPKQEFSQTSTVKYVAPSTNNEKQLCKIWKELISTDKIGLDDSFFDIGGHSLLATRLAVLIRDYWQVDFPVRNIFEKQTIRGQVLLIEDADSTRVSPIQKLKDNEPKVLSFSQQRLWLISQINPLSPQYNMPVVLTFDGELDYDALQKTLNAILVRHDTLHTVYRANENGEPYPLILDAPELPIAFIDLSTLSEEVQSREVARLAKEEASAPFDLAQDLMIRVSLIRLGAEKHTFLATVHHIASDGWSIAVFTKDISNLYTAYVHNLDDTLPTLPVNYMDYAAWQKAWLTGEVLQEHLNYWRTQLDGIPVLHNLPLDKVRPVNPSHEVGCVVHEMSKKNSRQLHQFARDHDATLFMVLSACFAVFINRYSSEHDIVFGTPIANREHAELSGLVGFFTNTLVIRLNLADQVTFSQLVQQSKRTLLEAYEHQQMPFDKLVDELQPQRDLSFSPLFQLMLALQNNEDTSFELPKLSAKSTETKSSGAKYDLLLNVTDDNETLSYVWEYSSDLFNEKTVRRMSKHFHTLLQSAISSPDTQIGNLPLLNNEELNQIVHDWNDTRAEFPQTLCLHQPFEMQAQATPNAIAVVFSEQQLTYRELNYNANKVAHYLLKCGIKQGELVAICVGRSLEMVIGLLAILKAGAAYVPLDPSYPIERKHRIVEKADARFVLVDDDNFQDYSSTISINQALNTERFDNPSKRSITSDRAYVIFTSGSTGEPKGVVISHNSAVNLITLINRRFNISQDDCVLCITSVGFDLSVYDIFGTLATGAKLIISSAGDELEPRKLISLIERNNVTFWDSVPSTLNMLIDYMGLTDRQNELTTLRLAFLSGDWIPTALPAKATQFFPNLKVIGLGGATEGTVWSNFYPIEGDVSHLQSIPYGRPLDNNTFYVLDKYRQPVPLGVVGELYIGGLGVAQGYLKDTKKTTASFVKNPYHPDLNVHMYRTGDLGRILPTSDGLPGNMEFLGRQDHQVKIRGFRVELGDIESCLRQHELIKEVVVIASESATGLIAYFTSTSDVQAEQLVQELKRHTYTELPEYMVPSCFIHIDALPLSGNGKIDRKALPKPNFDDVSLQDAILPESQTEARVLEIWEKLLGLTGISVISSFFDVGGQSLLVTRLAAEIYREFTVELSTRVLFQAQTIKEQAKIIEREQKYLHVIDDVDHLSEADLDKYLAELSEEEV
ncbi:non-ribosomal peptide synthetase [Microbulbifer sp. GL-2]|uniref:non-ribosomal peptide synthetase n=1 Tax=Microbulbifer sp. GL-2 TaxID=2591606 RepID=UPI001161FFD6|nr:non-ribosomal peptide synthetase [Microbulbifer sp. GL-2]BBM00786.1 hypothetical protein GL2_08600 [Microbulbifer sp. GL-2]